MVGILGGHKARKPAGIKAELEGSAGLHDLQYLVESDGDSDLDRLRACGINTNTEASR
jgi:hypothetical protein